MPDPAFDRGWVWKLTAWGAIVIVVLIVMCAQWPVMWELLPDWVEEVFTGGTSSSPD